VSFLHRLAHRSKDLLFVPGTERLWLRNMRGKILCLLYHRVDGPGRVGFLDAFGAPAIAPDALASELQFLKDLDARFMTFRDLRNGEFPAASEFGVIVSFDDGFRDNYSAGLDVLDGLGIRGVIFQSTALVESTTLIWEHALYWYWHQPDMAQALTELAQQRLPTARGESGAELLHLLRAHVPPKVLRELLLAMAERFDTSPQLASLAQQLYPRRSDLLRATRGGHELGSHGHHHYMRSSLDAGAFESELRDSANMLEMFSGERPKSFSYPFNDYVPAETRLCSKYFEQVATVDAAPICRGADPLALPRFTWPGVARTGLRRRRWLLTGRI
jgi:peptidoglycan/xylan/chitin deacetylase (PgdA/CDA1 family)